MISNSCVFTLDCLYIKREMLDLDIDKQILHVCKIKRAPKQNNLRLRESDTGVLTNSSNEAWKLGPG